MTIPFFHFLIHSITIDLPSLCHKMMSQAKRYFKLNITLATSTKPSFIFYLLTFNSFARAPTARMMRGYLPRSCRSFQ